MAALGLLAGCPNVQSPSDTVVDSGTPRLVTQCNALSSEVPMRLLTRAEYDNTLRDVLGDTSHPARDFPREPLAEGWDNDGNLNQVTDESVTRYLEAAEAVSTSAVSTRSDRLYQCKTKDAACGAGFVATIGRRLFRRSLTQQEVSTLGAFFTTTVTANDFDTAVAWTLQVMLQSPQFLYRFEEGATPKPGDWRTPLQGVELATRLSYLIWASAPDDALLDAAEKGSLADPDALQAQAKRLLADPKALDGKARFFNLWLRLDDIAGLEKSTATYAAFTPALAQAWRTSIDLFISDVLTNQGTLPSLLTSNALFVNDTMSMYAMSSTGPAFTKVMMPVEQRSGLLTQPGFLARLGAPDQSSPIRRGVFVLDKLMCQSPPPPPPSVNTTPPKPIGGKTTRERFAQHTQDPSCKGCHGFIDPIGFGFEHYDGIGAYRDFDNGQPVDATGSIVYASDTSLPGPFDGATQLMAKLALSKQVHDCVSKEWLRFAMGRGLGDGDACSLQQVQSAFASSGGSFDQLLLSVVGSDSFRTRPVEAQP